MKNYSPIDRLISRIDRHLVSVLAGTARENRPYPAKNITEIELNRAEKEKTVGFMRVNHAGEVSAQALYLGQAATSRHKATRDDLLKAADEERDHLAWCHRRLQELDGRRSFLDPLWFSGSFVLGAIAGGMNKNIGLGFVEETEKQVYDHLQGHLDSIHINDERSRKILEQMQQDEKEHGEHAAANGAVELPAIIQKSMQYIAKVMTLTAYKI